MLCVFSFLLFFCDIYFLPFSAGAFPASISICVLGGKSQIWNRMTKKGTRTSLTRTLWPAM